MYVDYDNDINQLVLRIPPEHNSYFEELNFDLMDEYGYDSMNKETIKQMNNYIINWFRERGIELPDDRDKGKGGS